MQELDFRNQKIGLVLEGGGLRGTYTSGVLDAFLDNGVRFPYIIGVSAGVCNAVSFVSRQKGRSAAINIEHCNDKDYYSVRNLLLTGSIFGEKMMFDTIPHKLYPFDYDTYRKEYTKLIAGTTDCTTGKPVYYEINDLRNQYDIVNASSWLPLLSKMVRYDGRKLLDGGASDSIPVQKALDDGCEKVVVILTQPAGFRKEPSNSTSLAAVRYRRYPNLVKTLANRHNVYNQTLDLLAKLEQSGTAIVIRPSQALGLSRLEKDPEKLRRAQKLGYADGIQALEQQLCHWIPGLDASSYHAVQDNLF